MSKAKILIVDDELIMRESLGEWLERDGYRVMKADSGEIAIEMLRTIKFDILLVDMKMEGMSGLDVLKHVKGNDPEVAVVIITAYGSISGAVDAMKYGAWDYLLKPFDPNELGMLVKRILKHQAQARENLLLKTQYRDRTQFDSLIGRTPPMQKIFNLIEDVSQTQSTVLITGETGTGKGLAAKAIHAQSPRSEEFALQKTFRKRAAVDHGKGPFGSRTLGMNGLGGQAFSGAGFPGNQNRALGWETSSIKLKIFCMGGVRPIKLSNWVRSRYWVFKSRFSRAWDYLLKPFDPNELGMLVKRILKHQAQARENLLLKTQYRDRTQFDSLIGRTPPMQKIFNLIEDVSQTQSTVLITGETGTGKGLAAKAIHAQSPRSEGPFAVVNCGAFRNVFWRANSSGFRKGPSPMPRSPRKDDWNWRTEEPCFWTRSAKSAGECRWTCFVFWKTGCFIA